MEMMVLFVVSYSNQAAFAFTDTEHNSTGHQYNIYEQKDTPEVDMFHHLPRWLDFLEKHLLGRTLEPDDYIFPHISTNGIADTKRSMTHETVQKYLNEFSEGAGMKARYTTHCFRRGGAQYRFMYAPLGKRWSLITIHWWGGWSEGESVSPPVY